jgi:glycosyltransferase involved in cell wall biosynthesis
LRNLSLFTGAIPSKVFETLAMEIPILLGVDGEARTHFVEKAKAALFVEPENTQMLIAAIQQLIDNPNLGIEMGKNGRKYAMSTFNRNKIAQDFLNELNALSQN